MNRFKQLLPSLIIPILLAVNCHAETKIGHGSNLLFSKKQWLDVGAALAAIKASERTIAAKAAPTGLTHYPKIIIGNFSAGKLDGWQEKAFKDQTRYHFVKNNNITVLQADSQSNASGLFYNHSIDLTRTPILHWSWKVSHSLGKLDGRTKSGDDYAARIYIVVSGGLAFWNTRSLNYVWANSMPLQSTWPSPFAGKNVMMIAQQSGNDKTGRWIQEQRNIRHDLKQLFHEDIQSIDSIAIMTDTDNSGKQATTWYGDIYFSAQ